MARAVVGGSRRSGRAGAVFWRYQSGAFPPPASRATALLGDARAETGDDRFCMTIGKTF
ncbi:MAG TPA: hypothetical protein VFP80_04175 [Thermoanaerobaculia bacterium]|nr:hypothetical protein [Thermoanaerobaculia bacterium]